MFGGKTAQYQRCGIVQVKLCGVDHDDVVTACVVPTICLPPSSQHIELARHKYDHLSCLQLADDPDDKDVNEEIQML